MCSCCATQAGFEFLILLPRLQVLDICPPYHRSAQWAPDAEVRRQEALRLARPPCASVCKQAGLPGTPRLLCFRNRLWDLNAERCGLMKRSLLGWVGLSLRSGSHPAQTTWIWGGANSLVPGELCRPALGLWGALERLCTTGDDLEGRRLRRS